MHFLQVYFCFSKWEFERGDNTFELCIGSTYPINYDKSINCNCTNSFVTPCTRLVIWSNCLFVSTYLCVILSPLTVFWSPSKTYPHLKSMYVSSCYPPISLISSKDLKNTQLYLRILHKIHRTLRGTMKNYYFQLHFQVLTVCPFS